MAHARVVHAGRGKMSDEDRTQDPSQCNCHRESSPCLNCRVNAGEFTDIGIAEWLTEDE